jgi:hypothetical protein
VDAIAIIDKLTSGSELIFPVLAMNEIYVTPLFFLIRVKIGGVNKYAVPSLNKAQSKMFGKLFKTSVGIWDAPRSKYSDFHFTIYQGQQKCFS